jgi:hypothetical protein
MLSDELEALAADAIKLFGVSLKTGGLVRKLRRLAGDARTLEQAAHLMVARELLPPEARAGVVNLEHARNQKRLTIMAARGKK